MLFAKLMKLQKLYFYISLCLALLAIILLTVPDKKEDSFAELVKIAMRDVGNKLLLTNQDSTSLILPIQKLEESKFQLSFEKPLLINPDSLVAIVAKSFQKAHLPSQYQIEVKQCSDFEVAYSFLKFATQEKSIIPCSGRFLPQKCYVIEVRFLEKPAAFNTKFIWIALLKVIKREELSKKVWEDHGVFVGRSLDTYISKLRKKLSDDESIKLTNVHGIGYMLEVKGS